MPSSRAVATRCRKSSSVPSSRQNFLVAALGRADGPGTADVAGLRFERVVRPLAVDASDRLDGREVDDVEAHPGDVRQARLDVLEVAVPRRLRGSGAGKELVPAAEARALAIGEYLQRGRIGETAVGMALHQAGALGIERKRLEGGRVHGRFRCRALEQERGPVLQGLRVGVARARRGRADERAAHLQRDANVGKVLAPLEFLAPGLEVIDPGRDRAAVAPGRGRRELGGPHVVSQGPHLDLVGLRRIHRPPGEHHAQLIVPVGEAVRLDADGLAGDALRDKTAAVDPGRQRVDDRAHPPVVARLERRRAWRRRCLGARSRGGRGRGG